MTLKIRIMNYVGEKPLDSVDVIVTPHTGEGRSLLQISVGGKTERILLETRRCKMKVSVPKTSKISWKAQTPGGKSVAIERKS